MSETTVTVEQDRTIVETVPLRTVFAGQNAEAAQQIGLLHSEILRLRPDNDLVDNENLGVCGLCGRDPQRLEEEINWLVAWVRKVMEYDRDPFTHPHDELMLAGRLLATEPRDGRHVAAVKELRAKKCAWRID